MDTSDADRRYDLRKTAQKTPKAKELLEEKKRKEKKDKAEVIYRFEEEEDIQSIDTAQAETTTEENYSTNEDEETQMIIGRDEMEEAGPSEITMEGRNSDVDQNRSLQNLLESIIQKMDSQSQKMDNQAQDLKKKMDDQSKKMDNQAQDLKQKIDDQGQEMKEIHRISATISNEIAGLKESVGENQDAIKQINLNFQQRMQEMEARFEAKFQESSELQERQIEKIINLKTNNISNVIYDQLTETRSAVDNRIKHLEQEVAEQQSHMTNYLMNTNQKVSDNEKELVKNIQNLGIHEKELEDLKKAINQKQTTSPQHITVTCTGANNGTDLGLPKYGRRSSHPMEFIGKLKNYYRKQIEERRNGTLTWEEMLENALEDNVGKWWQSIRDHTVSFSDFENKFIEKYWGHEIQRGIRRRIELEKYRPNGRLNRAEYFIERVLLLNQMTPRLEESDIITILSERYDDQIQDARRVQDIQTITHFEKLLSRYDIEEDNRRLQYANIDRKPNVRPTDHFRYPDRGTNRNFEERNENAYQNRPQNSYREPVRRIHPYIREEPKEGYYNRYTNPLPPNRPFVRPHHNGYKYPDNQNYRNYHSREPPNNWNHRTQHFKQESSETHNPRLHKYKTPEQEAVCQSINLTRTEQPTITTNTDDNQLTRELQTTHNNSAACTKRSEN